LACYRFAVSSVIRSLTIRCLATITALLCLAACNSDSDGKAGGSDGDDTDISLPESGDYRFAEPDAHLVRASMAIRGVRPSLADLEQVRADPETLSALVDGYVEDPLFGETVKDLAAELLLIRADVIDQLPAIGPLRGYEMAAMHEATAEAPLRLFEDVVLNDHPLTAVLTADWIWTNAVHSQVYGVAYDSAEGGWQRSHWDDGRPEAGILSDSELWRRFESAGSNFHRLRANFIAGAFLCEPFDTRDIDGASGVDISDEAEVANAVMTTPACINCHQALDPLAGYWWGFKKQTKRFTVVKGYNQNCRNFNLNGEPLIDTYVPGQYCYPLENYTVSDEGEWHTWGLRPPNYYGEPAADLIDVAQHMADDSRFSQCMARTFYGYLTQTDRLQVPLGLSNELQAILVESDFSAKALVKAIVLSDSFRAQALSYTLLADPTAAALTVPAAGLQTIRPEQYSRTIEDLTGFRWFAVADLPGCQNARVTGEGTRCWGTVDLGTTDFFGFRAMSGGINGYYITAPTHTMTPPKEMVMARYAAEAAAYVTTRDLDGSHDPPLLLQFVGAETTDEASVREQLVLLHDRILAESVDDTDPAVDASFALWQGVLDRSDSTETAWQVVIAALLRDPRMIFY
jgi:hypothetical protein